MRAFNIDIDRAVAYLLQCDSECCQQMLKALKKVKSKRPEKVDVALATGGNFRTLMRYATQKFEVNKDALQNQQDADLQAEKERVANLGYLKWACENNAEA